MEGPAATIALVLAETAAGGSAVLWLTRLWGSVKRGFFVLTTAALLLFSLLATLALGSAITEPVSVAARWAVYLAAASSAVLGLSLAALILRFDVIGRVLGWVAIPALVALLMMLSELADAQRGYPQTLVQLMTGALLLGAVLVGLLLGHWYLTDRKLPREHIRRFSVLLIAAVVIEGIALAVLGLPGDTGDTAGFSVILGVSGLTTWLALGMVGCTLLIAFLIRASLRGESARAVQGATGFFYLAVITAFTAEMAAKVGFLE